MPCAMPPVVELPEPARPSNDAMTCRSSSELRQSAAPPRRITIYFQDDEVRRRAELIVHGLLVVALEEPTSSSISSSAVLAKKALKYRKVLDRMAGVDVLSPEFDASAFLGVEWCKTPSLKAHCMRQQ